MVKIGKLPKAKGKKPTATECHRHYLLMVCVNGLRFKNKLKHPSDSAFDIQSLPTANGK